MVDAIPRKVHTATHRAAVAQWRDKVPIKLINKTWSPTKKGPGRVHAQGNSRKRSALNQYPGTHRERREKKAAA